MSIKLVAIDIDGTLLNEKREVTKEVKEAIAAAVAKGVSIVLCTGRPLPGVQEQLNELNLFQDNDYVITYNGALVQQTKSGKIIARHGLTHEDFLEIEVMARRVGSHLHSIDDKAIYTPNRDISAYTIHEASLVKMPLKYRTPEEMTPDMNIVKSAPYYFEVLNKEASKGAAVANLAQHLGIDQDEIMAIGDNENDLSMIEYAGLGVAMGNAVSLVKEAANVITSSNDEHGVAAAIKKYVL